MLASILQTISVMIAATSVVIGVGAWRRSLRGQRQFDLAEQVAEGFAQAKSALAHIRSPFGLGGEGATRKRGENETEEERQILDNAFVAIERYNKHSEVFSKLMPLQFRFELYFGKDATKPFNELNSILNEIISASRRLSRLWIQQGKPMAEAQLKEHLEKMYQAESVFWEGTQDPDQITVRVDAMVKSAMETCQKVITPRRTFCSVLRSWFIEMWAFFRCRVD